MLDFIKKYKFRIAAIVIVAVILAFAYWYGGGSEDSRGWVVSDSSYADSPADTDSSEAYTAQSHADVMSSESISDAEERNPEDISSESAESVAQSSVTQQEDIESLSSQEDFEATDSAIVQPEQSQQSEETQQAQSQCTVTISCGTILENLDKLDENKRELVPSDGLILAETEADFNEGDTAFDLLQEVCRASEIHLEAAVTPLYGSAYIEGIGNIYEFDCGSLSGWMYSVNGEFPNYSCSEYTLSEGDVVEFVYTCDLGGDVGGDYYSQNQ